MLKLPIFDPNGPVDPRNIVIAEGVTLADAANFSRPQWATLFVQRCREYYLRPAHKLDQQNDSYAVLLIACASIDFIVTVVACKGVCATTGQDYISLVRENLKDYSSCAEKMYKAVRCGLVHNGRIKFGVLCSSSVETPMPLGNSVVVINPKHLTAAIENWVRQLEERINQESDFAVVVGDAMRSLHQEDLAWLNRAG